MSRHSLVVFGLSITSSWGNGHATTYRGLLRALAERGWQVTFFERDVPWYRDNRDLPNPSYVDLRLYESFDARTRAEAAAAIRQADAVMVGSYAGEATDVLDWLAQRPGRPTVAFYDIDTPITLTALQELGTAEYLRADQVPLFDVYFSFTGGPALEELREQWGAQRSEALYCGVDASVYQPVAPDAELACSLGYMGTYAEDRQSKLEELLIKPARLLPYERFLIAGPQYPEMRLPWNVVHLDHLPPPRHAQFYSSCRATLNLTRAAMVRYGWSPSVRLFEAAACGACIVSDWWPGLDELLAPGREILIAHNCADMLRHLAELSPQRRAAIGEAARKRVLAEHTYERRAATLERTLLGIQQGYAAREPLAARQAA